MSESTNEVLLEGRLGRDWKIRRARPDDLPALVALSVAAFADDERFKPPGAQQGGPKGHDRIDYHAEWMRKHPYLVCTTKASREHPDTMGCSREAERLWSSTDVKDF